MLVATDLDGTISGLDGIARFDPKPTLCISGRTWAEYDNTAIAVARLMPLYIRGIGEYGDREAAALFKMKMILLLGVTHYYEDDPVQASRIAKEFLGRVVVFDPPRLRWVQGLA